MLLFLDDIRMPDNATIIVHARNFNAGALLQKDVEIVRSYKDFVEWIEKNGLPGSISFDHDLADISYNPERGREIFVYHEKTGYDCAKWLVEYCLDRNLSLPLWAIHSANPVGIENIKGLFMSFERST